MTTFDNARFVKTIQAPINNSTLKSLSYDDLNDINNYYEIVYGDKPVRPYIDIDGELPNYSMFEFDDINNDIVDKLMTLKDVSIMTSSKFNCKKMNKNNEVKYVNKLSYRLTFYNEKCSNIKECRNYIQNVKYPILKQLLKDVIELTDSKTDDGLNIDYSVYRSKGKIRCVNAFKDLYDVERINRLIKGNIEQTIISLDNNMEDVIQDLETKTEPVKIKDINVIVKPKQTENIELNDKDRLLNDIFNVNYKWDIIKESDETYKINHNSYNCLVNPEHNHSELNHSCLYLNNDTLISSCHSHGKLTYDYTTFNKINKILGLKIEIDDEFLTDVKEQMIKLDIKSKRKPKKKTKKITNKKIKKLEEQLEKEKQKEKSSDDEDYSKNNNFCSIIKNYLLTNKDYKNTDINKIVSICCNVIGATTEKSLSELYIALNRENLYVYDNIFYLFTNDKWFKSTTQDIDVLRFNLNYILNDFFTDIVSILKNVIEDMEEEEEENENYESIKKICNRYAETNVIVNKTQWLNNIMREVRCTLKNQQLYNYDIFDKQHHIFAFKNVLFDLNTNEELKYDKSYHITLNSGKDYIEPTQDEMDTIHNIFVSILPDEEVRKCYLSILFNGLTGYRVEKIIIANGSGRNGKGLLNEMMEFLLGVEYSYKVPIDLLTKDVNMMGVNPQLANMKNKRFVISSEPQEGRSLKINTCKEITGCSTLNARGLYQTKSIITLLLTLVIEANSKPLLEGTMDDAVLDRIVDVYFPNSFTTDEDKIDNVKYFRANTEYKQDNFQMKHYSAFFKYIINNAPKNIYEPYVVKKRSKEYVMDNDDLYMWFDDNYVFTKNDNDIIKVKDIFKEYKNSSYYTNLTKKVKRKENYKHFNDKLKHHIILKKMYKDDMIKRKKVVLNCSRLHGIKEKYDCDLSDIDSD